MAIFLFFKIFLLLNAFFSLLDAIKGEWRAKNKYLQAVQTRGSYFSVALELNKSKSLKKFSESSFIWNSWLTEKAFLYFRLPYISCPLSHLSKPSSSSGLE